jgi:hypothetical protein
MLGSVVIGRAEGLAGSYLFTRSWSFVTGDHFGTACLSVGERTMRHLCLITLLFLSISLTACSRGDGLPTLVPTADASLYNDTSAEDESPRATPDPGLPPTWTPPPTAVPATPLPPPGTTATTTITYVIQPGDTLGQIAARYGVTVAELARLNNISNVDRIEVGDTLLIPQPVE